MIVDLERNDLGARLRRRVGARGRLHDVERHPTVQHLVSSVRGTLVPAHVELAALLAATFPGGSITGAPKLRAMEIIAELEPWPAGRLHRRARGDRPARRPRAGSADPHGDRRRRYGPLACRRRHRRRLRRRARAGRGVAQDRARSASRSASTDGSVMFVWLNGRILPARASPGLGARSRPAARRRGLRHVAHLWRRARSLVAAHLRRLAAACRTLQLPPPGTAALWEARVRLLLRRNGLPRRDRPPDDHPRRRRRRDRPDPTRTADDPPHRAAAAGRPRRAPGARRRAPRCCRFHATTARPGAARSSSATRAPWSAACVRPGAARPKDSTSPPTATVTEGTTSNLFVVERGRLLTPPLAAGVLAGVTRDRVLRLARRAGVPVRRAGGRGGPSAARRRGVRHRLDDRGAAGRAARRASHRRRDARAR